MSVECPCCEHVIKLKGVKAGRYSPKCPKCGMSFALTVSGEEGSYEFTAKSPTPLAPKPAPAPKALPQPAKPKTPAAGIPPVKAPPAPRPSAPPIESSPSLPAPQRKAARPPPPSDPEEIATAILSSLADVPDTTGGWVSSAAADEAPSAAPEQTGCIESASEVAPGQTSTGEDDNADFEADLPPEEAEGENSNEEEGGRKKKKRHDNVPPVLGGYEIVELLGQGGMGTVYLARQVSLDRPVALKVMNARWASDPAFVARFTREAYAAAQLVHHNIVQIYDIGFDHGIHFFSMEFVKGQTLSDAVKDKGKLDVEEAVGYILQAARGLQAAHDAGMVHRDVKPDNLMLNELGVVKVADLGLVKTPGAAAPEAEKPADAAPAPRKAQKGSMPSVTNVGTAMGTPTYMAPEQGRDAGAVDQRADIYSLGCTLYVLLTGRPPFKGNTALEVMIKHLTAAPIPPEVVSKRVPKEVSAIVMKMMAKKPEDRHQDMFELIGDLEKFLGVSQVGATSPGLEHTDALESAAKEFQGAPAAKLRSTVLPGYYGACVALSLVCAFFSVRLAISVLGLALMTACFTFLVRGLASKTHLFSKVREFMLGSGWSDWLTWGVALLLGMVLLHMAGILAYWMAFLVLGGAIAGTIRVLIDKPLENQRKGAIEQAEKLLKSLRLRGLREEAVRQFMCKYSGQHWEEFFETLFGYEALVQARKLWSRPEGGKPRPTYAAWRDPVVQWIDARQRARQEAKERRLLQQVEQQKLEAAGVKEAAAQELAAQAAAVMVSAGASIKQQASAEPNGLEETSAAPMNVQEALKAAEKPRQLTAEERKRITQGEPSRPATQVLGPKMRFLLGAVLVILCYLWMSQRGLLSEEVADLQNFKEAVVKADHTGDLRFLPGVVGKVFSGFAAGLAGLLLALSALTRNKALLFFLVLAVLVLLAGPLAISEPILGIGPRYLAMLAGFLLAEFGFVFARSAARPKML